LSVCLGLVVGCGPNPDTSKASPEANPTETTTELEKAAESGQIDPATYGQEGN
jgi:hypothetical protein